MPTTATKTSPRSFTLGNGIAAHYDYAPFGAVARTAKATSVARDILSENPFRFSSEVHDNSLGLVYYNYRHYNPKDGRWLGRDPILSEFNFYLMVKNNPILAFDSLGLLKCPYSCEIRLLDFRFTVTMASTAKMPVSVSNIINKTMEGIAEKGLKEASDELYNVQQLVKLFEKHWDKGTRIGNVGLFTLTSTGSYVESWEMEIEVRFRLSSNEEACQDKEKSESFSEGRQGLYYCVYTIGGLRVLATSVAEGSARLLNDIYEARDEYKCGWLD